MRVGAIDIGSYSVRLTIADVSGEGIRILLERGYITSLGSGIKESGRLNKERVEETLRVLEEYKEEMERLGVDRVVAVATEALRRAENSQDFLNLVKERTGIEVRIITPEEEGRLAFLATAYSLRPEGYFLVVDQGGGSTEFVFGRDMEPESVISLPVGIVNLTEEFLRHDPPTEEEIEKLLSFLEERIAPMRRDVDELIGLGGTITTITALEYRVYPYDPEKIHGRELTLSALRKWFKTLVSLPYRERSRKYRQIEDRRAEVIVSGIAMFIKILEVFGKDRLRVGDWGVKHGLLVRELVRKEHSG